MAWNSAKLGTLSQRHQRFAALLVVVVIQFSLATTAGATAAEATSSTKPIAKHKAAWLYVQGIWQGFATKWAKLRRLNEENEFLTIQLAQLDSQVIRQEALDSWFKEGKHLEHVRTDALAEVGSVAGRSLASLGSVDTALEQKLKEHPNDVYQEAIESFLAKKFDRAAFLLHALVEGTGGSSFVSQKNYMLMGRSFLEMQNFTRAREYFEKGLISAQKESDAAYGSEFLGWLIVTAHEQKKPLDEQSYRKKLFSMYPDSATAKRFFGK